MRALAAFQTDNNGRGLVLIHHNTALTHRDRGDLDQALAEADTAVELAGTVGAVALFAGALCCRAEIRIDMGDLPLALRDVESALAQHREISDEPGEAEDLRVLALVRQGEGDFEEAERLLRDSILMALTHRRPLLAASAGRDLARMYVDQGRIKDAVDA